MITISKKKYYHFLVPICIFIILTALNLALGDVKGATVGGFVEDISGKPVEGAEIFISESNGSFNNSNLTNKSGEYRFDNVPMGNYTVICFYNKIKQYEILRIIDYEGNIEINITIRMDVEDNGTKPDDDNDDKEKKADEAEENAASFMIILLVVIIIIIILSLAIFSRIRRSHILNHETRDRISSHIRENPGVHFTALKKDLGLSTGVLSYHMERLEREKFVVSRTEGKYKRFYPPDWDEPPGIHLSQIQEIILEQIKRRPGISQSDLGSSIGRNRKVINYQAHQLRELGLIDIEKEGRESRCYFVRDA